MLQEPKSVYYEEAALGYETGKMLAEKYKDKPWVKIDNHNNIPFLRKNPNSELVSMKQSIVVAVRKTHKYTPNHKTSDFLVPYTSSGCSAFCMYCYLVCNYNKCSYLRIFVNREQMLEKIIKTARNSDRELTFEIGSNSDLVLENSITGNLEWTVELFGKTNSGYLTLPTKFDMVQPLLPLNHNRRTIIRMSVNPEPVIQKVEFGTSRLMERIHALNLLCDAGYKAGLLVAPVIMLDGWHDYYTRLFETLRDSLTEKTKKEIFIEIIFMTYSYVHRMINNEAFPNATELYDKDKMTGRGMGKYWYKQQMREEGEVFLRALAEKYLPGIPVVYVV